MSDKICECGHPLHSIPCPDTSGDDGEGHVTICGCHRLASDKLPALPPRPKPSLFLKVHSPVLFENLNKYMDAQDDRIKELEGEIREAHELMVAFAYGGRPLEAANLWMDRDDRRNAEKEQGS
jgi:hypothetical protein